MIKITTINGKTIEFDDRLTVFLVQSADNVNGIFKTIKKVKGNLNYANFFFSSLSSPKKRIITLDIPGVFEIKREFTK
jgi:hypothetical protein